MLPAEVIAATLEYTATKDWVTPRRNDFHLSSERLLEMSARTIQVHRVSRDRLRMKNSKITLVEILQKLWDSGSRESLVSC